MTGWILILANQNSLKLCVFEKMNTQTENRKLQAPINTRTGGGTDSALPTSLSQITLKRRRAAPPKIYSSPKTTTGRNPVTNVLARAGPGVGCLNTPSDFLADIKKKKRRTCSYIFYAHFFKIFRPRSIKVRSRQVTSPQKKFECSS